MLDQQDADTFAGEVDDELVELSVSTALQPAAGSSSNRKLGLRGERAGNLEPLERAIGEVAGRDVGLLDEADAGEELERRARVASSWRAIAGRRRRLATSPARS